MAIEINLLSKDVDQFKKVVKFTLVEGGRRDQASFAMHKLIVGNPLFIPYVDGVVRDLDKDNRAIAKGVF